MAVLRYNGPWDERELWGVIFRKGASIVVDNPQLVDKALCLDGFERLDDDAVSAPAPDDYAPVPDAEPEEMKIPVVGSGTIPDNWRDLHWKQRVKLAKDLSGMDDISTTEAADATIEALLKAV
jgi:hypothetical protein